MTDVRDRFLAVQDALNEEIYERHDEVRGLLVATLSNKHIFLLGAPGLAKSYLLDRYTARINGLGEEGLFKYLLSRFTNDAEIFGPFALSLLKQDRFKRITDRKAPKAHFFVADEVFKASSTLLNSMLRLMNEREFFNDDDDPNVPLITLMGASNELPTSAELNALADRFHLWYRVLPIAENSNLVKMLTTDVEPNPEKLISLDDIYAAQEEVQNIPFPEDMFETVLELKEHLAQENITISDRRLRQAIEIAKAEAWLNGHESVEVYDLRLLQFMCWRNEADIPKVRNIVLALTDPLEREVLETLDHYNKAFADLERVLLDAQQSDSHQRSTAGQEALGKWRKARDEYLEFASKEKELGRVCRANQQLRARLNETIPIIAEDAIGIDLDTIASQIKFD